MSAGWRSRGIEAQADRPSRRESGEGGSTNIAARLTTSPRPWSDVTSLRWAGACTCWPQEDAAPLGSWCCSVTRFHRPGQPVGGTSRSGPHWPQITCPVLPACRVQSDQFARIDLLRHAGPACCQMPSWSPLPGGSGTACPTFERSSPTGSRPLCWRAGAGRLVARAGSASPCSLWPFVSVSGDRKGVIPASVPVLGVERPLVLVAAH
jgi:hypothetical protein